MDEKPAYSSRLAPRMLPWMVALAALVVYWITVCRWLNPLNLEAVGQASGWLWQLPYHTPLMFLVCLPLRVLPDSLYPIGANLMAGVFGAVTLGLLARSIALLPYDRTREGRIRGHADEPSLHIRFSWVPPLFAAALLGFQLTFWEHATAMTGEMLNLMLFAYCIRCLLEYRLDVRETWLWRMALVYGLGITNNWAMIGFAPFFLIAMIWIRGFSFFNFGFLLRLTGFLACGLLLYLFMPLWLTVSGRVDSGFFDSLYAVLVSQKTILLGMPRGKAVLLSLVCIMPFIAMGVRWAGTRGSSIERGIAAVAVYLMKFAWLAGCVMIMFNLPFSPREMMQAETGLAMLTFYYLAAVVAGYFIGLFLLVFGTSPDRHHGPPSSVPSFVGTALHGILLVGALGVPIFLAVQSYPKAKDTGILSDVARELMRPVPSQPSILVADTMTYLWLAEAERRRTPNAPEHLLVLTGDAKRKDYQTYLEKRYLGSWPDLAKFTKAESGVLLGFLNLLAEKGRTGNAFYLHHSFGLFFELVQLRPRGLINQIEGQPSNSMWPPALSAEEVQRNLDLWKSVESSLRPHAERGDIGFMGWIPSRAANFSGVELQRAGRLEEAGRLFEFAAKLMPKNTTALENSKVNESLRAKRKLNLDLAQVTSLSLTPRATLEAINGFGPSEDPAALFSYGRNCLDSPEELYRQAASAFHRLLELLPGEFPPLSLLAASYLKSGQPDETLKLVRQMREMHARQPLAPGDFADLVGLESMARSQKGDADGALRLVQEARSSNPENLRVLDTLVNLLLGRGKFDEAGRAVAEWNRAKPEDSLGIFRRGQIQMYQAQYQPAIDAFSAVLKKEPSNRAALLNRATCNLALKKYDDARRDYLRLAEEFPDRPEIQFGLGEIAFQKKNTSQALEYFEHYLEIAPRTTETYTNVLKRVDGLKGKNR